MTLPSLPPTQSSGGTAPSTWANSVRTMLAFLRDGKPLFKGYGWDGDATANIIATATNTTMGFGNAGSFAQIVGMTTNPVINSGGWTVQASDGNPESLVVPEDGVYRVTIWAEWGSNSTGVRQVTLLVNGSGISQDGADQRSAASAGPTYQSVAPIVDLSANDQLDVRVNQTSGGDLGVEVWLSAEWIQST